MTTTNLDLSNFTLVKTKFSNNMSVAKATPKECIFLVDVSGSMYGDLPYLREEFKNKIVTSLNQGDTLSIIYYSSNGDYGFILKRFKYDGDIDSLQKAQKSIDMLRDRNLTGFVDPLNLAIELAKEIKNTTSNAVSIIFMSDGYENQNSKYKVITATKELSKYTDNGVVVEFGNYANHNLLMEMSSELGGQFVYAKDFQAYNIEAMNAINGNVVGKYNDFTSDAKYVFSYNESGVTLYNSDNGNYRIPENVTTVFALDNSKNGTTNSFSKEEKMDLFGLLYVAVLKGNSVLVWDVLCALGDVDIIDRYSAAIGKQKLNEFLTYLKEAFNNPFLLYSKGEDRNYLPDENAFCLLDLLNLLQNGDNYFDTSHPQFSYNRIGRKKVQKTVSESDILEKLKNVGSLEDAKTLLATEPTKELFFVKTGTLQNKFSNLVFNTSRANISVRCTYGGYVEVPRNSFNIPPNVQTYIHRNYTIVKDGVVNFEILPVKLDQRTFAELQRNNMVDGDYTNETVLLDISELPVVNRAMTKELSVEDYVSLSYQYLTKQAWLKVFNHHIKELCPKQSEAFVARFGQEGADWLKEIGITEFNGFSPKSVYAESTDFYYCPTLDCSLKGKTLPTVTKAIEAMEKGKLNSLGVQLMAQALEQISLFLDADDYKNAIDKDKVFEIWLKQRKTELTNDKQDLEYRIAQMVTTKLLSKSEWADAEKIVDGKVNITIALTNVVAEIIEKEIEVKI